MESSMDLWKPVGTVKIRVYKYNPRRDFAPGWKEYEIEVSRGTTILDALLRIKEEMDPLSSVQIFLWAGFMWFMRYDG
jgi:succinate dehydrogenase / fumarate reductase iron-sulfur subunit